MTDNSSSPQRQPEPGTPPHHRGDGCRVQASCTVHVTPVTTSCLRQLRRGDLVYLDEEACRIDDLVRVGRDWHLRTTPVRDRTATSVCLHCGQHLSRIDTVWLHDPEPDVPDGRTPYFCDFPPTPSRWAQPDPTRTRHREERSISCSHSKRNAPGTGSATPAYGRPRPDNHRGAATPPAVIFDPAACYRWLAGSVARQLGIDESFNTTNLTIAAGIEDLLAALDNDPRPAVWNVRPPVRKFLIWRTSDGDGVDGGAIITVDLDVAGQRIRLATLHQGFDDFTVESATSGVRAAVEALGHVVAVVNAELRAWWRAVAGDPGPAAGSNATP